MNVLTYGAPYFLYFKENLAGPSSHSFGQLGQVTGISVSEVTIFRGTLHHIQLLKHRKKKNQDYEQNLHKCYDRQ